MVRSRRRQSGWTRLEMQHDNLRAALRWSLADDDSGQTSLRFVGSLAPFWRTRGYFSEGRAWIAEALRLNAEQTSDQRRVPMRFWRGTVSPICNAITRRHAQFYEEALDIYQQSLAISVASPIR